MASIKQFAVAQAIKRFLPLIAKISEHDAEKLFPVAERLAPTEFSRSWVRRFARVWREHPASVEVVKRGLREVNSRCRARLANNMIINCHWYGTGVRDKAIAEGLPGTFSFIISPTMRCNLHCIGCYAASYSVKDDLEFEVMDRVLNEGKQLGIYVVNILGGEPFIREEMWEIYRRHNDIVFQVFTNGTLVDKEAATRLGKLGNVVPMVSIEGFEEETDARRGRGVFQKTIQAMDNLRQAGVLFGFSTMVTRHNVEAIISDEFNDMLIEHGCILGWHFLYIPVGQNPDPDLMPTPEQRELLRVRGADRIRSQKPIFIMDFWNDAPYVRGCVAGGRHYFHINSHGDVEPCIFVHFAVDNVKGKSLKEILMSPYFRAIRARQPFGENLLRPCMIIDYPQVLRDICAEFQPYPTHPGAESLLTSLHGSLDEYAEEAGRILDKAWQERSKWR